MGKEFVVKKETLNEAEKKQFDEGWLNNAYNEYASRLIPLNRTLEDIRQEGCKSDPLSADLPTASIIMCFHNEALSVLLRGVHSVVDRSPDHLLTEVLLVDDFSDMRRFQLSQPLSHSFPLIKPCVLSAFSSPVRTFDKLPGSAVR
jgi:polypeptide N-acetylgalactosaminyltransferase